MKTFKKGGVHPPEMKDKTKDLPFERLREVPYVAIPMLQHFGNPAELLVKEGDHVLKGQLIGRAVGHISANVHASVSGKIKKIENGFTPMGRRYKQAVIENDGQEKWIEGVPCEENWKTMSSEDIVNRVADAGIVGMGGAAFPTAVKLRPPREKIIDTVILNGIECEPYLTVDHRLMLEHPAEVVEGLLIILKAVGAKNALIGIEANKPDAYQKIRQAAGESIRVQLLDVKYPQGAEKQLISALTGREVPPGKLPFDVGVLVNNVGTAYAISNALTKCVPLIERPLTVSGDAILNPANLIVPVGTPLEFVINHCGLSPKVKKVILGGPMMGIAVADLSIPVTKGMSGVLGLLKLPRYLSHPCIRCGKCIEVCPLGGIASEMAKAIESGAVADYEHLHVFDCMECGTCAYVCPANRPLVQYVRQAKEEAAYKRELHRKQQKKQ